jgi:hypothetical protein
MIAPVCLLAGTTTLFAQTPNNHIRTFGAPQGATAQAATRPQSRPVPVYGVAGLRLGSRVQFDSSDYREYKCSPSEQFADFTWCQKTRQERDRRGYANVTYSILHSQDGTVVYVNRFQEPALFALNEADAAIRRYSSNAGEKAQIKRLPPRPGFPAGMLATWGKVTLEPLDSESINTLAEGKSPKKGYLVDFIGNFTRSAKEGLPVYRLSGGAGFVWVASADPRGRGTLRFAAIDPSALPATSLPNEPKAGDAEAKALDGQPPPIQGAETSPAKSPSEDAAVAHQESDLALQQAETAAEKSKADAELARNESEAAKRDAQLAQAEVERLSAALEQSEAQRASAEAKARRIEIVAYGGTGILIALLAIVSSALLMSRRKVTAAKLPAITPEANPSHETAPASDGRNSQPLRAGDTVSSSSEPAHSPPSDMSVGKSGDGGISDMKSTPNSDTAEERVTLPI